MFRLLQPNCASRIGGTGRKAFTIKMAHISEGILMGDLWVKHATTWVNINMLDVIPLGFGIARRDLL